MIYGLVEKARKDNLFWNEFKDKIEDETQKNDIIYITNKFVEINIEESRKYDLSAFLFLLREYALFENVGKEKFVPSMEQTINVVDALCKHDKYKDYVFSNIGRSRDADGKSVSATMRYKRDLFIKNYFETESEIFDVIIVQEVNRLLALEYKNLENK